MMINLIILFQLRHKKEYKAPHIEEYKKKIYLENWRYVAHHNSKYEAGLIGYKMSLNQFADMVFNYLS